MIRLIACLALMLCSSQAIAAQSPAKLDLFGGYSFFRVSAGNTDVKIRGDAVTASRGAGQFNGWNAGVAWHPIRRLHRLAVTGDYTQGYGQIDYTLRVFGVSGTVNARSQYKQILAGPQFTFRSSRATLFVRAQGGVAYITQSANLTGQELKVNGLSHAVAFGGGIDLKLTRRFSWRVAQGDYVLTRFRERIGKDVNQNSLRLGTGLVFHLGIRK